MVNLRIALLVAVLALTVWGLLKVDAAMKQHFSTRESQIMEVLK